MFSPASKPENKPQASESSDNQLKIPSVSLPKGGGAIRGIGEKFAANPVTGTGSLSVPIFTSPGRSGFGPQLSLSYDSGSGNGLFGFGWNLSLPSITRKTDKGLPRYQDAIDSDVFILSGAEDLVPVFKKDNYGKCISDQKGNLVFDEEQRNGYIVRRYRPRIEGLFARVERWTKSDSDVHWRSISKDNILTIYGKDDNSRIFDQEDPTRIFSWLICETRDDKGNVVVYEYKPEDCTGIDLSQAHESNRYSRTTNRYLKHIKYGNRVPLLDSEGHRPKLLSQELIDNAGWMFEVVFDYEDHDSDSPKPGDDEATYTTGVLRYPWKCRQDPFSSYRAGFEIRTYRLCQRVLIFNHFPDEESIGADCLVRSTNFTYSYEKNPTDASNPIYSFLLSVQQTGYKHATRGGYLSKSLPSIEFEYSKPIVNDIVEEVDSSNLENLPIGIDGTMYQWTDLHGEGIPGILTEQGGAWFYKRNLSPIPIKQDDGKEQVKVQFAPIEKVSLKPNLILGGGAQFMDMYGDGQPDLVVLDGPMAGFYEHDNAEGWQNFRLFRARLNRNFRDPNLKFVDIDGDGRADVLITEDNEFVWHPCLGEEGFGPACHITKAQNEEKGPRLVFADGTNSIYLADMSGDGLTDLVRINNYEICYWPNLGYGRFGSKITMDLPKPTTKKQQRFDKPDQSDNDNKQEFFDNPDQFDHKRILLADIDGSGTTDIIYLHRDGVRLYYNQSGNSWSKPHPLNVFPRVDNFTSIIPIDLLGNGTACLVWSSPLPANSQQPMKYVNLMGGQKPDHDADQQDKTIQKPHLLTLVRNNLGAETRIYYAPSTKFYLQDKRDGKSWITRLPFPVHVVERVETYDRISCNRFVTRYAYHHGYFDGEEREFRGFGMVEQWDTEEIGTVPKEQNSSLATNLNSASFVPPIHTKTWFHTGAYEEAGKISQHLAHEYYGAPKKTDADFDKKWKSFESTLLPDTIPLPELTPDEEREACRALKGSMLRQEIYSDDAPPGSPQEIIEKANTPYAVTEQNFMIETVQPKGSNNHAVFFVHPHEILSYHYERNPDDPRIGHAMILEVDKYGNVLKSVAIGYGCLIDDSDLSSDDQSNQNTTLVTYTENSVTNSIDNSTKYPDDYRTPLPCETKTYELTGYAKSGSRYCFDNFLKELPGDKVEFLFDTELNYEDPYKTPAVKGANRIRRIIEYVRTLYRPNDLGASKNDTHALLPLGTVESFALPGESYKLAFTPGLINEIYGGRVTDAILETEGRYIHSEGDKNWWITSGRVFYSPKEDDTPDDELTAARKHFFLPRRFCDPFGNNTIVNYDSNKNDPSKNYDLLLTETYDALENRVTAENDYRVLQPKLITDPNGNRSEVRFDALGMVVGTAVMGKESGPVEGDSFETFTSDLTPQEIEDYFDAADPRPLAIDNLGTATTRIIYDLDRVPACAATIARETHVSDLNGQQTRVLLSFSYSDGFGREIQKKIQAEPVLVNDKKGDPRWVGSGWTIFNNKGKPVRQYEPFFSNTHQFEFDVRIGVSSVLFYDPMERVVATLHPNHTYEKVIFDPWRQEIWDVNDTVTGDPHADSDISGFVAEYFKQEAPDIKNWKTWLQQRDVDPQNPPRDSPGLDSEKKAAIRTLSHANTPTVAYFDTLGRTFLTIAHNKFQRGKPCDIPPDNPLIEEFYPTRVVFDIEGNQREVRDENKNKQGNLEERIVMRYDYDMLGNKIHQASMEAGERWMLNDVTDKPIHAWDSRDHHLCTAYDELRRPTESYLIEGSGDKLLVGLAVYGETQTKPEEKNLRGKVYQVFDQAGVVTTDEYDFKGNLLHSYRKLANDYKNTLNWSPKLSPVVLETETFTSSTTYDALNRPIKLIAPHSDKPETKINIILPNYNEANLLESIEVNLHGATDATSFVTNIDYNAKGQRTRIVYGSGASKELQGVTTTYDYDPLTFRLVNLTTIRDSKIYPADCPSSPKDDWPGCQLQNLSYTYDPAGNITYIRDNSQQMIYFRNKRVEPSNEYTYDAIYRLIEAKGREHLGQVGGAPEPHSESDKPRVGLEWSANDGSAMGTYFESYVYDAVGNIMSMQHRGCNPSHPGWTRSYDYSEDSQIIEPTTKKSNRLSSTTVNPNNPQVNQYLYDAHGNMIRMPHLNNSVHAAQNLHWDYKDQLHKVDLAGSGTAYYAYDTSGQRVRKIVEKSQGLTEERIYLGGFEVFRQRNDKGELTLERETLHIMDDKQCIALVDTKTIDTKTIDPDNPQVELPETLIRYQFSNHLGSSVLELDESADIISYEEYYPYGSTSYQAVRNKMPGSVEVSTKRYRYTGKERDEETGLYYHGARYYAPWLGRWVSCDMVFIQSQSALYTYVSCNPVTHYDIKGFLDPVAVSTAAKAQKLEPSTQESVKDTVKPLPQLTMSEFMRINSTEVIAKEMARYRINIEQSTLTQGKTDDNRPQPEASNKALTTILDTGAPFCPHQNRILYSTIQAPVMGTAMPGVATGAAALANTSGIDALIHGDFETAKERFLAALGFATAALGGARYQAMKTAYKQAGSLQNDLVATIIGDKGYLNGQITISTGVGFTADGSPIIMVSTNAKAPVGLISKVRAFAEAHGAKFVEGTGDAEANIYKYASKADLYNITADASNNHCVSCTKAAEDIGARTLNVNRGMRWYQRKYNVETNYPSAPDNAAIDPSASDYLSRNPDFPSVITP